MLGVVSLDRERVHQETCWNINEDRMRCHVGRPEPHGVFNHVIIFSIDVVIFKPKDNHWVLDGARDGNNLYWLRSLATGDYLARRLRMLVGPNPPTAEPDETPLDPVYDRRSLAGIAGLNPEYASAADAIDGVVSSPAKDRS